MVRMGQKYEIKHLRDEGYRRLLAEFPATLEGWDLVHEGTTHEIHPEPTMSFDAIRLALESGIEVILPIAYYSCISDGLVGDPLPLLTVTYSERLLLVVLGRWGTHPRRWIGRQSSRGEPTRVLARHAQAD